MGLPICQARRSWVSRLLAPPCFLPRELFDSTILTVNFHNLIFNLNYTRPVRGDPSLGGAGLKISFSRQFAIKGFSTSTLISGSCIYTITAAAFSIDNRLLDPHRLQPLVITGQKAAR